MELSLYASCLSGQLRCLRHRLYACGWHDEVRSTLYERKSLSSEAQRRHWDVGTPSHIRHSVLHSDHIYDEQTSIPRQATRCVTVSHGKAAWW